MVKVWACAAIAAAMLLASVFVPLAGSPALAADVEITSDTGSVDLDTQSGSTAHVAPAVTVSGAITATTSAWTLDNDGAINAGLAVQLNAGGAVNNNATGGIDGGTNGAVIIGNTTTGGEGTVVNTGTIKGGTYSDTIALYGGGTVTNLAAGKIISTSSSNAVSLSGGTQRIVYNHGSISDTGSSYATGILIQGGAGSITNYAGGTIFGAYNGIYTSASAPLTLTNDGSISSTRGPGVELHGGGTVTNTGTITSAADAMTISGAATVTNTGSIGSTGSGRAIAFSGSAAHTLNLGTGSVLTGNVQGGSGTDNLVLEGTGSESIAKFLGFETLAMQGTDWTLTGAGTFSTSGTVANGRMAVDGTLTTATLSILSGGILGGSGTVAGAVTNGGTIAPGNSIGTLTVASVLFSPNSIYSVEIDPVSADLLKVTGTATIDPTAKVSVTAAAGTYTTGHAYQVLTAGTLSGTFAGVVDNSAFLDFSLDYAHAANEVWLDVTTVADFIDVAETPNQRASASGAQALGAGNAIYEAVAELDAPTARAAFDLLSGEIHASAKGALLDQSRFVREAALARLQSEFDPTPPQLAPLAYAAPGGQIAAPPWPDASGGGQFGAWAQVFGSDASASGDGNAAGLDRQIGGFIAGGDWTSDSGWRFGAATGVDTASLDEPARASSASVGSYHLAIYGGFDSNTFKARGGAAVAWEDVSTRRDVSFPGYTDTLTADYGAHTAQAFGEIALPVRMADLMLEPYAGAAWVGVDVNGFTEQGGAAALTAPASHATTTLASFGLRFDKPLDIAGVAARLAGSIGWQHAFGGLAPTTDLAFTGGAPFAVAGTPRGADLLKLDLGVSAALGPRTTAMLGYSGEIGSGTEDHALKGRIAIGF